MIIGGWNLVLNSLSEGSNWRMASGMVVVTKLVLSQVEKRPQVAQITKCSVANRCSLSSASRCSYYELMEVAESKNKTLRPRSQWLNRTLDILSKRSQFWLILQI